MKISLSAKLLAMALLLLIPTLTSAESMFSGNPPDGRTNAPGEGNCTGCHASFTLNSGDGAFQILGLPSSVTPGQTVSLTLQLSDPGQSRWGFELTAIDANDAGAQGAGVFTVTDFTNTQLSDNGGTARDYMKHTSTGTQNGTANGPVTWTFDWTAPLTPGEVFFYAAGNAADGNGGTSGDYIYTASTSTSISEVIPAPALSPTAMMLLFITLVITGLFFVYRRQTA